MEQKGFWVRGGVNVPLTKEEKVKIGKPSAPRPEIDLIAYSLPENTLYLLEVKSYLDSNGVVINDLLVEDQAVQEGRYKLLTSENYRRVVESGLVKDLTALGLLDEKVNVKYGLIAGNVASGEAISELLRNVFQKKGWFYWGPKEVALMLGEFNERGYEDDEVTIAIKVIMRNTSSW